MENYASIFFSQILRKFFLIRAEISIKMSLKERFSMLKGIEVQSLE